MAENYREQQQEEAEGIVDAGGFENDPGTGMIAEDQETAAAADTEYAAPVEASFQDDEEAIEETEAAENVHIDLHEDTGSGIDVAVIVIILLVVIGCISFGIWNAPKDAQQQQIIAQQQAAQQAAEQKNQPPYEVVELSEGVAAVVNGDVIEEATIDEYVAGFRKLYDLQNEDDWAAWLLAYDYTPENIRNMAVATYVDEALIRQGIEEYGVVASQATIDEIYNAARENFETEEAWQEGLEHASTTEEAFREQCKQDAEKQALREYLGERWFATPEDEDAELLVAVKQYYPEYANVESLDGISEEKLEPVREMVVFYAQQDAYNKFLKDAKGNGDIKMSAMPSDIPYNANLLLGMFRNITMQMEMAQLEEQE